MARWKKSEETYLTEHAGDGAGAIAEALGRSVWSVRCKASELGISLVHRYFCPRCGRYTYTPLAKWSGWCRTCSVSESGDTAALKNRQIRKEIEEEKAKLKQAERRRQMIYTDTDRKKKELRRLRESRQSNDNSKGDAGE